jgi:hypothetical protein
MKQQSVHVVRPFIDGKPYQRYEETSCSALIVRAAPSVFLTLRRPSLLWHLGSASLFFPARDRSRVEIRITLSGFNADRCSCCILVIFVPIKPVQKASDWSSEGN